MWHLLQGKCSVRSRTSGFTLVEMVVAVALFAVVALVCIGTLLALIGANRRAQALQSVMNNLNVAVDGMARSIRQGSIYHCSASAPYGTTQDCSAGATTFAFEPYGGHPGTSDQWIYKFIAPSNGQGGYINRSEDGGTTWVRLTAPEVSITGMQFFAVGTTPATVNGDMVQPQVVIVVQGTAGSDAKGSTSFHLQVSASQRALDI